MTTATTAATAYATATAALLLLLVLLRLRTIASAPAARMPTPMTMPTTTASTDLLSLTSWFVAWRGCLGFPECCALPELDSECNTIKPSCPGSQSPVMVEKCRWAATTPKQQYSKRNSSRKPLLMLRCKNSGQHTCDTQGSHCTVCPIPSPLSTLLHLSVEF